MVADAAAVVAVAAVLVILTAKVLLKAEESPKN